MSEFHETGYGRRFFDAQLPALIVALERIADALEEANETKNFEIGTKTVESPNKKKK